MKSNDITIECDGLLSDLDWALLDAETATVEAWLETATEEEILRGLGVDLTKGGAS